MSAVVVTGIGPVSSAGIGLAELLTRSRAGGAPGDASGAGPAAALELRPFTEFDPAEYLGRKGWKFLPPVTRCALAAARLALADAGVPLEDSHARAGVVIGTNTAVAQVNERIDLALLAEGVAGISAVECPNFAVNVPASQVSIALGMRAFNITLVGLLTAGLDALVTGAGAVRRGRADAVLVGAIEGAPPPEAGVTLGPVADDAGACLLHLEPEATALARGARVHARLEAWARGSVRAGDPDAAARLDALLERVSSAPDGGEVEEVWCLPAGPEGAAMAALVTDRAARRGGAAPHLVNGAPHGSVTAVLQAAARAATGSQEATGTGAQPAKGTSLNDCCKSSLITVYSPLGQITTVRLDRPAAGPLPASLAPALRSEPA